MAKKNKREVEAVEEAAVNDASVEEAAAEEVAVEAAPELVDFETWFAMREARIPGHHHREILKADFNARKVPALATMAQFDAALEKYGVKLA